MFYIYIYISIYVYIYSHTLKRDEDKDQIFPGNWFYCRAPEPSREGRIHDTIGTWQSHRRWFSDSPLGELCISREDPCLRACFGHIALAFAINIPLTRVLFWSWSWVHLHCVWGPVFLEILCAEVSPELFGWPPSPASDFEPPSSTKFRHSAPYKPLSVIHIFCLHRLQKKTRTNFPPIILSHHLLIR